MMRVTCPITAVTPEPLGGKGAGAEHYFFGYYDKCPWEPGGGRPGRRLLAHRTGFLDRFPSASDAAEIGLIDEATRRFEPLARTRAWNWQQGSQLQWLPGALHSPPQAPGSPPLLVYNDRRDGRLVSVIADAGGREQRVLDEPIYAVAPDGSSALTLSYPRLTLLRPEYGYPGLTDPHAAVAAPDNDGIFRLDLRTGRRELLVSIAAVAAHRPSPLGAGRHHYVNHLMYNPSGARLCFLHRFQRSDGIVHSRLFTLNAGGGDLRLLMEGMISHYSWRDDDTLLAWAGRRKLLAGAGGGGPARRLVAAARRSLKPIYYALGKPRFLMNRVMRDSYLLISDAEKAATEVFAASQLTTDGHCTWSPGDLAAGRPRWVLTDGYPDLRSRQPLYLWDTVKGQGYEIGRYPTPRGLDGAIRVDLHPRFSRDGRKVCIDSAMDGRRRMYVVDVAALVAPGPPTPGG
jgi:hypothetical protein